MSFRKVILTVDTTDIENRLDAIEAAGPDVLSGIVMCLKDKRMSLLYLLKNTEDGDQLVDENGDIINWDADIKVLVETEIAETERIIGVLGSV
jgi:hypothetical protein